MGTIALRPNGRFGSQMFQYAFARAYAERYGLTLEVDPCLIHKVFDIDHPPVSRDWPVKNTNTLQFGEKDFTLIDYCTVQKNMIYTRSQVRMWFKFRDEFLSALKSVFVPRVVCHQRAGDYAGAGYVVVTTRSYYDMIDRLCLGTAYFCRENYPILCDGIPSSLSFLADFWAMMHADVLLRANSSFSWWAATLGHAVVYSPVVEGLRGGQEQDCPFTQGNHPRFICNDCMTDLTLLE